MSMSPLILKPEDLSQPTLPLKEHKSKNTTFAVFMDFITVGPNGKVDVNGIFTKECLNRWLETRAQKIKFPQQSFQRVLYSHVRALYERRPFPEKVEDAILLKLRNGNPWKKLLTQLGMKLRKRKFKHLGFHEKNRLSQTQTVTLSQTQSSPTPAAFLPLNETLHDKLLRMLEANHTKANYERILYAAKERGYDLLSAPVKFMMSLKPNPRDLRFDPNFFIIHEPPAFSTFKPVGMVVVDYCCIIRYVCPIAKQLMGMRDLVGTHVYGVSASGLASCLYHQLYKDLEMFEKGVVGTRDMCFAPNGKVIVFHGRTTLVKTNDDKYNFFYEFQDATEQYPAMEEKCSSFL